MAWGVFDEELDPQQNVAFRRAWGTLAGACEEQRSVRPSPADEERALFVLRDIVRRAPDAVVVIEDSSRPGAATGGRAGGIARELADELEDCGRADLAARLRGVVAAGVP